MTLLELVQQHCRRTGITVPSIVASSFEAQIQLCLGLLNEDLDELTQRKGWQILQSTATWTSLAGSDQGELRTRASGIINDGIIAGTFWDRTAQLQFTDPLTNAQRAANLAQNLSVNTHSWKVVGGRILLDAAFPVGHTLAFDYYTEKAVVASDTTRKQYFTLDNDVPLLPSVVMLAGLRWRWKREQGLSYDEDFRRYETLVANAMGQDGGRGVINTDPEGRDRVNAGIVIPIGSWSVP